MGFTRGNKNSNINLIGDIELVKEDRRGQWVFFSINENHEDYPFIQSILLNMSF